MDSPSDILLASKELLDYLDNEFMIQGTRGKNYRLFLMFRLISYSADSAGYEYFIYFIATKMLNRTSI